MLEKKKKILKHNMFFIKVSVGDFYARAIHLGSLLYAKTPQEIHVEVILVWVLLQNPGF